MSPEEIANLILGPTGAVVLVVIIAFSYVKNNWRTPSQVKELKDDYENQVKDLKDQHDRRLTEIKEDWKIREEAYLADIKWWRDKTLRALEVAERSESVSNGK